MHTTVIIPCHNEGRRLDKYAFYQFLEQNELVGFVFVDDGSTDNTFAVLSEIQKHYSRQVDLIRLEKNCGKAEAVRRGLNYALAKDSELVGFWDADLSTPLSAVLQLRSVFFDRPGIQWVFGSRVKLLGRCIERKKIRHYLGRIFASFASIILNLPVYDTQCGAKLFRSNRELENILKDKFISRWIFDVELIARLIRQQKKEGLGPAKDIIYEFPLYEWTHIGGSKIKLSDCFLVLYQLIKVWYLVLR